jgi:RimJ/RimL family protein N-acetyltransferase
LPYSDADLVLTRLLESDPVAMRNLGGAHDDAYILDAHQRRIAGAGRGEWWFKIVPEPGRPAVGTIGTFESELRSAHIHEVGWSVLPGYQGHGYASGALELLLARARAGPRYRRLHALPGIANTPSNALCRRFGFVKTEQCDVDYAGRILRCNHWELDVSD